MRSLAVALLALISIGCTDQPPDDEKTMQRMANLIETMDLPTAPTPAMPAAPEKSVPPVGNLLEGLEQRLAKDPSDASGWALLAQSYAFVGRDQAASDAVQKAVALGMDESELTARVDKARKPHPSVARNP
jgi:cytochrome c-type biogenesis protein CcmH/NrfG